jgi:predicted CopG family antitoxin
MSKSIRLSEAAYEWLAAHKQDDETFSEIVLRLAGERSLVELAGILSDEAADDLRAAVEERRDRREVSGNEDFERLDDDERLLVGCNSCRSLQLQRLS